MSTCPVCNASIEVTIRCQVRGLDCGHCCCGHPSCDQMGAVRYVTPVDYAADALDLVRDEGDSAVAEKESLVGEEVTTEAALTPPARPSKRRR